MMVNSFPLFAAPVFRWPSSSCFRPRLTIFQGHLSDVEIIQSLVDDVGQDVIHLCGQVAGLLRARVVVKQHVVWVPLQRGGTTLARGR